MTIRTTLLALLVLPTGYAAAAQEIALETPGSYILLLDKDKRPLAGSYRIGAGVKILLVSSGGGLPRDPTYLDRAFFPTREGEMLSFYNARHAYSPDPAAVDVGEEARIVDHETLLPPLFKDQKPERETALRLTVSGRNAFEVEGRKLIGKSYRIDGYEAGEKDWRFGEYFHVETLDIVLPAADARSIVSIETGTALGSGDFHALYVERSPTTPDFAKCVAEKRNTAGYKALAEKQKAVDAFMATAFMTEGKAFWVDKALYEANYAMSVFTLCPP